ncbi:hypothetical protein CGCA056_v012106 [Colletotrichum aenigma]|uniref:uncharacterized protein n=1 Tax=Colletotrichum aenigma TaxID=1215731 RepID=UPI0018723352|nr:uncharacterized protein CGCA056_v012106 [Colletotrichum aenigma]KAF5512885.1 hypothetical protein CGCA056_v012106 [Colletotrichum aenigma]
MASASILPLVLSARAIVRACSKQQSLAHAAEDNGHQARHVPNVIVADSSSHSDISFLV